MGLAPRTHSMATPITCPVGVVEDEAAAESRAEGEELGAAEALGEAGVVSGSRHGAAT